MRDSCSRTAVAGTGSAGESPADFTGEEDGIGDDLITGHLPSLAPLGHAV